MRRFVSRIALAVAGVACLALTSCAHHSGGKKYGSKYNPTPANYASRIPHTIASKEKTIVVYPRVHVWGAYKNGQLIRSGLATAGGNWCADVKRPCRTTAGTFRIKSLGAASCKSSRYPKPNGGAPMPYCMFFNGHQGLHGSKYVFEGNGSHGCVRLRVADAEWIRFNFANIGTKVIVRPY